MANLRVAGGGTSRDRRGWYVLGETGSAACGGRHGSEGTARLQGKTTSMEVGNMYGGSEGIAQACTRAESIGCIQTPVLRPCACARLGTDWAARANRTLGGRNLRRRSRHNQTRHNVVSCLAVAGMLSLRRWLSCLRLFSSCLILFFTLRQTRFQFSLRSYVPRPTARPRPPGSHSLRVLPS